jgi:DNA modification methylase
MENSGAMQLQLATRELGRIHQGDCLEILGDMVDSSVDLAFADPPFNIGYEYDEYHDKQDEDEYVGWCSKWMGEVHRVLKPNGTFWLAIGDEYAAELKMAAKDLRFATRSWVVWYYTFGVNCTKKFSRSHVHLFHFVKDENNFTFNADDSGIRVPSARALVYADKRANPAGRLPDDTWILRPQDLPEGFQPSDDTWYFARVAGTFAERQGFHGCQMPEQLLGRIVRASSNPDDVVLDPFAGSGTTLAVAKKLGRQWVGCELSEEYVRAATERLNAINQGESLDGPANPIASAPSTANGRKLDDGVPEIKPEFPRPPISVINDAKKPAISISASQGLRGVIRDAIVDAFYLTHDGYSIDWLLANPFLQSNFHDACDHGGLIGGPAEWNRELLRLRKTGEFPKRKKIKRVTITVEEMDDYVFAAEIAWRIVSEQHKGSSLDEIFCDPAKALVFDRTARRFGGERAAQDYRWAAFHLRKSGKELVEEANKYRESALKRRDFGNRQNWSNVDFDRYRDRTGVYILRGDLGDSLYVGQCDDLGGRLERHASSRSKSMPIDSLSIVPENRLPAGNYLGPLKVDLARHYDTRFNVDFFAIHKVGM